MRREIIEKERNEGSKRERKDKQEKKEKADEELKI